MPTVSVVVPTRARARFLPLALKSALEQERIDLEVLLVVDGADSSAQDAAGGADDARIRVLRHEEPRGVSAARNTAIAASDGEWLAFLDDDDLWAPTKVREQIDAAERTGSGWAYTGAVGIDAENRVIFVEPVPEPRTLVERLPRLNVVPTSDVVVRRDTLAAAGVFDVGLRSTEDWDVFLRLARAGSPAFVPRRLVAFRTHADQSSLDVSRLLGELDAFEHRHGVKTDRGAILRGAAWSCLRAGRRSDALRMYGHAIRYGDVGSFARLAVALLPAGVRTAVLERVAGVEGDPEAQAWIDSVCAAE
jgi:glycosyltransferase involved in cell wall biosynthesis